MTRLVVLLGVLLLGACTNGGAPASSSPSTTPSAVSPVGDTGWLAGLPEGRSASVAYRVGRVLSYGGRSTTLPSDRVDLVAGYGAVLVRERDGGRITAYRPRQGFSGQVAPTSGGMPAFIAGSSDQVVVPRVGSARVDLMLMRYGDPRGPYVEDSQTFPVPCCDGRFRVAGTTQFREVVVDSSDGPWVWDAAEGQEGVPYDVPDSDAYVEPFPAPYDADLLHADSGDTVFFHDSSAYYAVASPEGEGRLSRGLRRFSHFRDAEFSAAAQYALVSKKSGALDIVDLERYVTRRLPVPVGLRVELVSWEARAVLLDVTDEAGHRALVRCQVRTAACARAGEVPRTAVLATRTSRHR